MDFELKLEPSGSFAILTNHKDVSSLTSSLEIMLGGGGADDMRHLTHTVPRVRRSVAKFGPDAREDALEIESEDGARTLLIFETLPELQENL